MSIQAVLFEKSKWSKTKAKEWLKKNGFKPMKAVHETDNFYRYRIIDPAGFKSFSTKKIKDGISYVIGYV